AYYYHSLPYVDDSVEDKIWNLYEGRKRFFHALNMKNGITVRQGKVTRRYDQSGEPYYEQKLVDILLVIDLANFAVKHLIDHAVIVSGDSNFVPAVSMAQDEGVKVTVWHSPTEPQSNPLLVVSDDCYAIDEELVALCGPAEGDGHRRREEPVEEPEPSALETMRAERAAPTPAPGADSGARPGNGHRPPARAVRHLSSSQLAPGSRASGWDDAPEERQPRNVSHERTAWAD
ncbi:MAG TPA: NYN domain-containing protein, partial [bacterium]|nr:NYN domain-containing protein [bacterium]